MTATLKSSEIHLYDVHDCTVNNFGPNYCVMLEFKSGMHIVNVALSSSAARILFSDLQKALEGKEDMYDMLDGEEVSESPGPMERERDYWKRRCENMGKRAGHRAVAMAELKERFVVVVKERDELKKKCKDVELGGFKLKLNTIESDRDYWRRKCEDTETQVCGWKIKYEDMETIAGQHVVKLVELKKRLVVAEREWKKENWQAVVKKASQQVRFDAVEIDRDYWKNKYENTATSADCYVAELQTLKLRLDAVETDRNCWKKKYKDWEKLAMIPIPIGCKKRLNAAEKEVRMERERDYWKTIAGQHVVKLVELKKRFVVADREWNYWKKRCRKAETQADYRAAAMAELKERVVAAEKKRDELKNVVDKLNKVEDTWDD